MMIRSLRGEIRPAASGLVATLQTLFATHAERRAAVPPRRGDPLPPLVPPGEGRRRSGSAADVHSPVYLAEVTALVDMGLSPGSVAAYLRADEDPEVAPRPASASAETPRGNTSL